MTLAQCARCYSLRIHFASRLLSVAAIICFVSRGAEAIADDYLRVNPDGSWQQADRWTNLTTPGPGVPGTADTARFIFWGAPGTIFFDNSVSVRSLAVGGTYTFSLSTGQSLSVTDTNSFLIGSNFVGPASLAVTGGTIAANGTGIAVGTTGSLSLNGGTIFHDAQAVDVGYTGVGTLTVDDAHVITPFLAIAGNTGTTGHATVTSGGSILCSSGLGVGLVGTGDLTVDNSGTVTSALLDVGGSDGAIGTLNVNADGEVYSTDMRIGVANGIGTTKVIGSGAVLQATGQITVGGGSGAGGNGTFYVSDGGAVDAGDFIIGESLDSVGEVYVNGNAANAHIESQTFVVGDIGKGNLSLSGDALVTANSFEIGGGPFSHGTVTVNSHGVIVISQELIVGSTGEGSLNINAHATVTADQASIGGFGQSDHEVKVDGTSAVFSVARDLVVGGGGKGTLTVGNYGVVLAGPLYVGSQSSGGDGTLDVNTNGHVTSSQSIIIGVNSQASGTTNVNGQGAVLLTAGGLTVGDAGTGTLNIHNFGQVSSQTGSIGRSASSSNGNVVIDGQGKWTIGSNLIVGNEGQGTVSVTGIGSELRASSVLVNHGTIQLSNSGLLAVSDSLVIGENGLLSIGTGMAKVGNAVGTASGLLVIGSRGLLYGKSRVTGGQVISTGGVIRSEHTFTIEGDLTSDADSWLQFNVQGLTVGDQYSHLVVTGNANIAGGIALDFENGFAPKAGDVFQLISATGTLATSNIHLDVIGIMPGWNYNTALVGGTYQLTSLNDSVAALPGDFNFDGVVDAADYVVGRKRLGTTYTEHDLDVWRAHFGQPAGSGAGTSTNAAIPEPATLVLLICATAGWCLRRGRTEKYRKRIDA